MPAPMPLEAPVTSHLSRQSRIGVLRISLSGLSPHWLGVHEAVVPDTVVPDPGELARHDWLTESELGSALREWHFTPDSHEAFSRYLAFRAARS